MTVKYVKAWNGNVVHIGAQEPYFSSGFRSTPFVLLCGGMMYERDIEYAKAPTCRACAKQVERLVKAVGDHP